MENEIDVNEIVKITQMPEIYSQLDQIGALVEEKTKDLNEIECTEENKQEVKKYKSYLNSLKTQLEDKRKEIKKKINEPYEQFNTYYEEKVKSILTDGINTLNQKIDDIESKQLELKTNTLLDFFNEYIQNYHLEGIVDFKDVPIKINLSTSETALKNAIVLFLEGVSNDLVAISSEENKEEILLEYQHNGFDYTKAKITIFERHRQIEELARNNKKVQEEIEKEQQVIEQVDEIVSTPVEVDEIIEVSFTIKTTKEKIHKLKEFLKENNIDYE